MSLGIPPLFLERLQKIIPAGKLDGVIRSFSRVLPITVRINLLKIKKEEVLDQLKEAGIEYTRVSWNTDALILAGITSRGVNDLQLIQDGCLYRQALSSMLPVLVLAPKPGERVLDLCAAPGSKTTQIAAMMDNKGELVAVEAVKARFFKLKAVCQLLGAENVSFKITDGRRFRSHELFDKVLVDAPCSSEGRFSTLDKDSLGYWSERKIKEMVRKQRGLLLTASRLLKPGGVLVYSTCTFAPEENEGVVDWALRKAEGLHLETVSLPGVEVYPALAEWEGRDLSPEVKKCVRVLPEEMMEGFFIAKFRKEGV